MMHKELWTNVLKTIMPKIQKGHFLTWFANTSVLEKVETKIVVGVPNIYANNVITERYADFVFDALKTFEPDVTEVEYLVKAVSVEASTGDEVEVKDLYKESDKKVRKVRNLNEIVVKTGGAHSETIISQRLNNRYDLGNFVVGQENRLPHAACLAVSNMPGGIYNPLYIYGGVGLGKTHLLQAVGNETLRRFPDKVIKYITAEKFVTELIEAIGKRYMPKFKDQYRKVDVFLVDDIQFFARKDSSQQEFFHTFNELYESGKQIVLTSDRSPKDLDDLDERLKSRFGMGMVVELLSPDFETRLAILHQKCREYQIIIDPKVLEFIAVNVKSSVRELEGILRQLIAESQLTFRVPTLKSAMEVIRRMNKAQEIIGYDIEAKKTASMVKNANDVINIVAEYYNLPIDAITGIDRHKEYMVPRQVCMYLIKNELGESYEKIGVQFGGKNHTTVLHACNKTSERLKRDIRLVRDINTIKREMGM